MICEHCLQHPHDPRCPDAPEEKPVSRCANRKCLTPIFQYENCWEYDFLDDYCHDCGTDPEVLRSLLGMKPKVATC